jgi:hypothetical protein
MRARQGGKRVVGRVATSVKTSMHLWQCQSRSMCVHCCWRVPHTVASWEGRGLHARMPCGGGASVIHTQHKHTNRHRHTLFFPCTRKTAHLAKCKTCEGVVRRCGICDDDGMTLVKSPPSVVLAVEWRCWCWRRNLGDAMHPSVISGVCLCLCVGVSQGCRVRFRTDDNQ